MIHVLLSKCIYFTELNGIALLCLISWLFTVKFSLPSIKKDPKKEGMNLEYHYLLKYMQFKTKVWLVYCHILTLMNISLLLNYSVAFEGHSEELSFFSLLVGSTVIVIFSFIGFIVPSKK
jgi:hypothetical protein